MFDISWTEFLLIGVVALIVIGPKELPAVMRTIGQWTRKVRNMAADFQRQFEAEMREAEFTDLKKQVDDIAQDIKQYDPLKDVRSDIEAVGKDLETSLEHKPVPASGEAEPAGTAAIADSETAALSPPEPAPQPAGELPLPEATAELHDASVVAAATGPVVPESVDQADPPDSTRHTA
jgi:sec-independent protein translocase protein TatB